MSLQSSEPASWVVQEIATNRVLFETFDKAVVDALNTQRYQAVPILQYLQSLNRELRTR